MMKFLPLVWSGLWRKPSRTILTALAVLAAFALVGALGAVDAGFRQIRETSLMDRLYVDARFGRTMPRAYEEQIAAIPGVTLVAPRSQLFGTYQGPRNFLNINATDDRFFDAYPQIVITPEQRRTLANTPNGVVLGGGIAKKYGIKAGDTIPLESPVLRVDGDKVWKLEVIAIVGTTTEPPEMNYWQVMNWRYYDEARLRDKSTISRYLLRIGNPEDAARIIREIDGLFASSSAPTRTMTERSSTENNLQSLGDINFFVDAIVAAVLFMLMFLTGNTMTQSVHERMTELAVMKTLGFTDAGVAGLLIAEAALQILPVAVAGLFLGTQAVAFSPQNFPRSMGMPWAAIAAGFAAALVVACVSSFLPAWQQGRRPVVDALADR